MWMTLISLIYQIVTLIITFSIKVFFELNQDKYNDLKRMIGWTTINYALFGILFFILLISMCSCCLKIIKFVVWISSILFCITLLYLIW